MFRNPHLWKAYQIDRLLNGCGNHQKYQRGCDHRSLSVYSAGSYLTVDHQHLGVPVFVGVGGGLTGGKRSVRLALQAEHQGAYGVVVNAPIADEVITEIKRVVDIPVIATIASVHTDVRRKLEAGADILNVSGAAATASMVAEIRKDYPDVAIIATGGPTNESILETIEAGANAITYTPPSNGELFARTMRKYREINP